MLRYCLDAMKMLLNEPLSKAYILNEYLQEVCRQNGSVSIVRGLRIQLSKDSRHSEQEEGKVLHTSYLCSEAFHLRVERLC